MKNTQLQVDWVFKIAKRSMFGRNFSFSTNINFSLIQKNHSFFLFYSFSVILNIEGIHWVVLMNQVEQQSNVERIRVNLLFQFRRGKFEEMYMKRIEIGCIEEFKISRGFLQRLKSLDEK